MEIEYNSRKLGELCTSLAKATRKHGASLAKRLRKRITQLVAVEKLGDLQRLGRCHSLKGEMKGLFAVRVNDGLRIVFKPIDDPLPISRDGSVDWMNIRRILIIAVEDYHG